MIQLLDRLRGQRFTLDEVVSSSIQQGYIPSISDIEHDFGEDAEASVDSILFSVATTRLMKPRKNPDAPDPAGHQIDAINRRYAWSIEDRPSIDTTIAIATHDFPEDNCEGNVAGALIMTKYVGELFGDRFIPIVDSLTNYHGIILKSVLKRVTTFASPNAGNFLTLKDATANDLTRALEQVKRELISESYGAIDYASVQRVVLSKARKKFQAFGEYIRGEGQDLFGCYLSPERLFDKDKEIYRRFVFRSISALENTENNLVPLEGIKTKITEVCSDLEKVLQKISSGAYKLEDACKLKVGEYSYRPVNPDESEAVHILEKEAYRLYVKRVAKGGITSIRAKGADNSDNLRDPIDHSSQSQHAAYEKAIMIIQENRNAVSGYDQQGPYDKDLLRRTLDTIDFHGEQLFLRVVSDNNVLLGQMDSRKNNHRNWLRGQYARIRQFLGGDDFVNSFRKKLKYHSNLLAIEPKYADSIDSMIGTLEKGYAMTMTMKRDTI